MIVKRITKDEINALPLFRFEGKAVIAADEQQIAHAINEIEAHHTVGFDTETKPMFLKGQFHHVALVQVATPEKVYLLRIHQAGITNALARFLSNENILKIGIALEDDLIALNKRRKFTPRSFHDLNKIAPQLGIENVGARNLSGLLLGFRISKSQQISNWENPVLTEQQVRYAATDAWICLEIFNKLKKWGYIQ
jgi:ribonuclease D